MPRALKHLEGDFLSLQGQTFNMAAVGPRLWGTREKERRRKVRSVGRLKRTVNTLAARYQPGDTSFKILAGSSRGRFSSPRKEDTSGVSTATLIKRNRERTSHFAVTNATSAPSGFSV